MLVKNTIVYSHVTGLRENDATVTVTGDYNLFSNNITNYANDATGGPNDITGQDPLFVNAVNNDFHLTSSSPAIDAGTTSGAPSTDFEGNTRPQGPGIDIGADEFALQAVYLPMIVK